MVWSIMLVAKHSERGGAGWFVQSRIDKGLLWLFVCLHTTESLCFLKKIIGNDTTFRLFSLPLHADTRSLTPSWCFSSFLKGRWVRRGLGRVEVSYIILKCVYYALSSWQTETWQFQYLIKDYAAVDALGMCIFTSLYWCGTLRK